MLSVFCISSVRGRVCVDACACACRRLSNMYTDELVSVSVLVRLLISGRRLLCERVAPATDEPGQQ